MPITSGGKVVLIAPNGGIVLADPTVAEQQLQAGYQPATPDDVKAHNRQTQYGTVAQQSLAQAERVVRGAPLGAVEGFGSGAAVRERADLSQEEHPYLSFAADLAPDIALGLATGGASAAATTAGRAAAKGAVKLGARAAIAAATEAAPLAAAAGEAVAGGLVTASQQAFQEGRQFFHENPVEDATNTLLWAGVGGVLGGAPQAFKAVRGKLGKAAKEAAHVADEAEMKAARLAGEKEAVPLPKEAGESSAGVPLTSDEGTQEAYARAQSAADATPPPPQSEGKIVNFYGEAEADQSSLAEAAEAADSLGAGKGVEDMGALPLDEGDRAGVEGIKGRKDFQESGNVTTDNFGSSPGGLPQFTIEGGELKMSNGRHRWTAAQEMGKDYITGRIRKFDDAGEELWTYIGPVRVSPKPAAEAAESVADTAAKAVRVGDGAPRKDWVDEYIDSEFGKPSSVGKESTQSVTNPVVQAEKGVARAERNATRSQAEDIVDRVARGEDPIKEGGGWLRDSRLARHQPEIIETATKEMRSDLNELNKLSQGIRERAMKQSDVAKNISDNLPAQQSKARDIALSANKLAGELQAQAKQYAAELGKKKATYFSGTVRDLASSLVERANAISKMTDGSEIFNALDDFKRNADQFKLALERGSRKSLAHPLKYQALVPKVEEFANSIRSSLEDVGTFGRAGEMQKAYNATYHQKWFPAKQVFEDSVFKRTGSDYRAFDTLDAWESKITGLLENPGGGERRHVGDMLGALKEMAEQRAKFGTASKKETARIVELVEKIDRTFKLGDETMAAKRRLESLSTTAGVAASALGALGGGLPGAIIAGGIAKGAAELASGKFRRAFEAMRGATEETVGRSVDDWIAASKTRSGVKGAKAPARLMAPADPQVARTAARLGTTLGFAQFLGDDNDPQSAFTSKRDALQDDAGFINRFSDEFGDLASEEPQVYAVAAGKAAEVRKFLLERLPSSVAVSMARPNGYPPTNEAIEDWSVYWNAATNPRSVLSSMSRGDIRPQEVETMRTLYRPLYERMQSTLIDRISNAQNMGDELDDQFVMRMSLLFDLDGAGTPAFSQRAANVARSVAPPQPPQPTKPFAPKAGSRVSPANVGSTGPTYGSVG